MQKKYLSYYSLVLLIGSVLFFSSCKGDAPVKDGEQNDTVAVVNPVPTPMPTPTPIPPSFTISSLNFTHYSYPIMNGGQRFSGNCTQDGIYILRLEHGGSTRNINIQCSQQRWATDIDLSGFSDGLIKLIPTNLSDSVQFTVVSSVITPSRPSVAFRKLVEMFPRNYSVPFSILAKDINSQLPILPGSTTHSTTATIYSDFTVLGTTEDQPNYVELAINHNEHESSSERVTFSVHPSFTIDSCSTGMQSYISQVNGCEEFELRSGITGSIYIDFTLSQNGSVVGTHRATIGVEYEGPKRFATSRDIIYGVINVTDELIAYWNRYGSSYYLYTLNTRTQELKRHNNAVKEFGNDPLIAMDGKIYFGSGEPTVNHYQKLFVLDPSNDEITQIASVVPDYHDRLDADTIVAHNSILYFQAHSYSDASKNGVYAYNPATSEIHKISHHAWFYQPVVFNNKIYFYGPNYHLYSYDPVTKLHKLEKELSLRPGDDLRVLKDGAGNELLIFNYYDNTSRKRRLGVINTQGELYRLPHYDSNQHVMTSAYTMFNNELFYFANNSILWRLESTNQTAAKWVAELDLSNFSNNSMSKLIAHEDHLFVHSGSYIIKIDENYNIETKLKGWNGEDAYIRTHIVHNGKLLLNMRHKGDYTLISIDE